jgi:hypothetical protein
MDQTNDHGGLLATYHQGNIPGVRASGTQCVAMAATSVSYAATKRLLLWNQADMDSVLRRGNDLYNRLRIRGRFNLLDPLQLTGAKVFINGQNLTVLVHDKDTISGVRDGFANSMV